ncbi:unnamed protein product [Plutella xylostella]|uniref:(diamondback moth) hypothetical protein n=1 Tax=Plutella xylostella TaxID=51655 RepID=A0A8S4FTV6_PLUXY|nr:unnamed protein product [Plutella xylostella]
MSESPESVNANNTSTGEPECKPQESETNKAQVSDLKNRLRKFIKKLDDSKTSVTKEESFKTEAETFCQLYKPKLVADMQSYRSIPKFYFKLPRPDEVLNQKLREETRAQFLQKKSKELLDNAELKLLWSQLEKSNGSYSTSNNDELTIDYFQYKKIRQEAGPKYKPYFTAEVFGRLQAAEGGAGRVRAVSLFNYVMRRVWLQQTRIGLSLYDVTGQGYLREHDLESYIGELVPSLAALDGLDSSFSSFYVCTAGRKFMFFLDPLRVGRVRIRDVLSCSFLDDLLEIEDMRATGALAGGSDGLDSSFSSFYVCTAGRKFMFFLDPLRVGRVRIRDVLSCSFLDDLLEVRERWVYWLLFPLRMGRVRIRDVLSCSFLDDLLELREEELPMELQEQNWFSAASALRVYGQYLNLDRDHNGMLIQRP